MIGWLRNEGMWYFGALWPVFQILNVSVGDLTDLGGCLNSFLVPESMKGATYGTCVGVWHGFGIAGGTYAAVCGTT